MIIPRLAADRGVTRNEWLRSEHSFSFGGYKDERQNGFGVLRVLNEHWVAPEGAFRAQPQWDMEMLTIVLEGTLQHSDSLHTKTLLKTGEVQRISAGSGITHRASNPSKDEPLHFLQCWIEPASRGGTPACATADFSARKRSGRTTLLVSPDGEHDSLTILQNARLSLIDLPAGASLTQPLKKERLHWLQVTDGDITLSDRRYQNGDGIGLRGESAMELKAVTDTQLFWFDLPSDD